MEGRVGPKLVLLLRSVRMLELRLEPKSVRMLEPWTELRLVPQMVPQMVPRLELGRKEGGKENRLCETVLCLRDQHHVHHTSQHLEGSTKGGWREEEGWERKRETRGLGKKAKMFPGIEPYEGREEGHCIRDGAIQG